MRLFEVVLVGSVLVFAWWVVVTGRPRRPWADLFGIVGVGGLGATQYFMEGYRWQMIPIYAAAAVVVLTSAWDLISPDDREVDRRAALRGATWATVGLAVLTILPVVLPVVSIPAPTGDFAVGTVSYAVSDPARSEIYGPTPGRDRQIAIQVWYPAASTTGVARAPWVDDVTALAPTASAYLGFPSFFLDHLELSEANAYASAPAADGRFPVIIYSHGWGGFRAVAANQMEELASHGFMVVAVDHSYASLAVTVADGPALLIDEAALPNENTVTGADYQAASELLSLVFTEDLWFVLGQLEVIDRGGVPAMAPVAGHFDLDRLGMMGHSTGGGAAITACLGDPRCDAVLGQDPWLEPVPTSVIDRGLSIPLLAVRSEEWTRRDNDQLVVDLVAASGPESDLVFIAGSVHRDFTLLPALTPLAGLAGLSGSLPAERSFAILNAVNRAFFEQALTGGSESRQVLTGFEELAFGE